MSHIDIWNCLHDGVIERVAGNIPGQVAVDVSIAYLRRRFAGTGGGFRIVLSECTLFEYEPYDEQRMTDLSAISNLEVTVLSVENKSPVVINCVMGVLRLAYGSASITTDAGQPVTPAQLDQASIEYWAEWSAMHGRNA